jgi:hypothetical protein
LGFAGVITRFVTIEFDANMDAAADKINAAQNIRTGFILIFTIVFPFDILL